MPFMGMTAPKISCEKARAKLTDLPLYCEEFGLGKWVT